MTGIRWRKLGHVFAPDGSRTWARTHAANPTCVMSPNGLVRVYVTSRDERNRSHIGWVELDPTNRFRAVGTSAEPVLEPGSVGLFDDSGVSLGSVVQTADGDLLYYVGWNLKVTVPWMNTIGLARRPPDSERFEKVGRVPVMDRSEEDPYSLSYPSVMYDGDRWRMWYGSNLTWGADPHSMEHVVKYAESTDGLRWTRTAEPVVRLEPDGEFAISRPTVRRVGDRYEMHYCSRGRGGIPSYRIGFATSPDGLAWTRRDADAGIDVSPTGWDSEMVCYPFVFEHDRRTFMLYNGNGYGRSGFGLAELEA